MKLLHMYPDLQGANTCCGGICSFEYLLFSDLELSTGLLTTLNAYEHFFMPVFLLARILLLFALKHGSVLSVPWP